MIRAARSEDLDGITALYRQLHPDDPVRTDGSDRRVLDAILETDGLDLYVLERDGRIVATAYLNVIPNITRSASPYAVIENVVVDGELRGRGYGKTLMAAVLAQAWSRGCYKAMLMTGSRDPSTHGFYQSCGFSAEEKTGYIARP